MNRFQLFKPFKLKYIDQPWENYSQNYQKLMNKFIYTLFVKHYKGFYFIGKLCY